MQITHSFELQWPGLESYNTKAMFSLFITEHCSVNSCEHLEAIVKNSQSCKGGKLQSCCSKYRQKEVVAKTNILYPCPLIISAKLKIDAYVPVQVYFKRLKIYGFFRIISSYFLAGFSWKFATRFLAEPSSFLWHYLAELGDTTWQHWIHVFKHWIHIASNARAFEFLPQAVSSPMQAKLSKLIHCHVHRAVL